MSYSINLPSIDVDVKKVLKHIAEKVYEEVKESTPVTRDRSGAIIVGGVASGMSYEYRGGTLKSSWVIERVSDKHYIVGNTARSRYPPYHYYGKYVEYGISSWIPHRSRYLIYIEEEGVYIVAPVKSQGRAIAENTRASRFFVRRTLDKLEGEIIQILEGVVNVR